MKLRTNGLFLCIIILTLHRYDVIIKISGILPESTIFLNSEIRKVQLEASDIPLHACIFGMDIFARMLLKRHFGEKKIVEIVAG